MSEPFALDGDTSISSNPPLNRRRHGRFRVSGQTMVVSKTGMVNGDILNISANGVCISGKHMAQPGEEVEVVHVPVGRIEGRVVRTEPDEIAIEFPITAKSVHFALDSVMYRLKGE